LILDQRWVLETPLKEVQHFRHQQYELLTILAFVLAILDHELRFGCLVAMGYFTNTLRA